MRVTLDIDVTKRFKITKNYFRVYKVQNMLFDILRITGGFKVRVSSSREGLHLLFAFPDESIREVYDDIFRLKADTQRAKVGLMTNILFKQKGEKTAGEWKTIRNEKDLVEFITEFFNLEY
jgi:hypothetical protein